MKSSLKIIANHVMLICSALILNACAHQGHAQDKAAPRFSVIQDDNGKYWFHDQLNDTRFLSTGVNHVVEAHDYNPPPDTTYYDAVNTAFNGDQKAWQDSTSSILTDNGFNTYGAWSSPKANTGELYETPILYIGGHDHERVLLGLSDNFDQLMIEHLQLYWDPIEHKDKVFGVFLDNEMAWFGKSPWDNNPRYTMLEHAFTLAEDNEARLIAKEFLMNRYSSVNEFSEAWEVQLTTWDELDSQKLISSGTDAATQDRNDLIAAAADAFYSKSTKFVRKNIPGVLILGTRFAGDAPDQVIDACGKYCDIVSYNHYRARPEVDPMLMTKYWLKTKKPLMITEYSWRAHENTSGNPNSGGAGSVVQTQQERGENYTSFVTDAYQWPMIVGMHWFEFSDQSPQGRFDGENSNYGLVDIYHRPYNDLLVEMKKANQTFVGVHQNSTRTIPNRMPDPPKAIVEISQYPNRPSSIDLMQVPSAKGADAFNADDATIEIAKGNPGLQFQIDTGATWGCGANIYGPSEWLIKDALEGATNLDGYSSISIEIETSNSIPFMMILDEAGVDSPNAPKFDERAGDDGESWAFETVTLKKGTNRLSYDLTDLSPRGVWGNQLGKRRVDTQALKGIGLIFPPGPSPTTIQIKSLVLEK